MKSLVFNIISIKISSYRIIHFHILLITTLALISCNYLRNDSQLAINDTDKITFIGIYGKDTVEIESRDNQWILNSDREPDPVAIDNFLYAFKNLEAIGATTGKGIDSLVSRKILIKKGHQKFMYRFYASDDFYLLHHEGSTKIFKIRVKSSPDANLSRVFSDRPSVWASRLLLNIRPGELQEVKVEPKESYGQGFIMKREDNHFNILNLEGIKMDSAMLNTERTLLYSSYFEEIFYSSEITKDSIITSIKKDKPFYRFSIETRDGNLMELAVYQLYKKGGEANIFEGAVTLSDEKRVLKINYVYLDPLFQSLSYFSVE